MENFIKYGLISFVVSLTLFFLNKGSKKEISKNDIGQYKLKLNKLYHLVGLITFTIGLVLFILLIDAVFIRKVFNLGVLTIISSMFLFFCGCGTILTLYVINHYVIFNETQIEVRNPFRKINTILWKEIASIEFNSTLGYITIIDNSGIKIKKHYHLIGLVEFLKTMEKTTNWKAKDLKIP